MVTDDEVMGQKTIKCNDLSGRKEKEKAISLMLRKEELNFRKMQKISKLLP